MTSTLTRPLTARQQETCKHMYQRVPTGACWNCRPEMFRHSPEEVAAIGRAIARWRESRETASLPACYREALS